MSRYIDAERMKFTGGTFTDENGETLVSLDDVRSMIAQARAENVCELPCGLGDVLYYITANGEIRECVAKEVYLMMQGNGGVFWLSPTRIGKTVFLTKADAEKYLEGDGK